MTVPITNLINDIKSWREMLAENFALNNQKRNLSQTELNYAVQITLDRLIFLRLCEDRQIEPYGRLQSLLGSQDLYTQLLQFFKEAAKRYNSGLFNFTDRPDISQPSDYLTPTLKLEDDPLRQIIAQLYDPTQVAFHNGAPEILGQIYEQFLGRAIQASPGREGVRAGKSEIRKAGGVYYTPGYIVDYIMQETVGKWLQERNPTQAQGLRVLDPACGSGAFLLGAYQYLLDWYTEQYRQDPERYKDQWQTGRLTPNERNRILHQHIFGVDLDPQAVEVTKLSLLLKALENGSQPEPILPDLLDNLKWGNALIGPDFEPLLESVNLGQAELDPLQSFDWQTAFPTIMQEGGFEIIVGNPPYIFTRERGIAPAQKAYFYQRYKHQSAQLNTFGIFVEKSYQLLREDGRLGFITPNNWLTIDSFAPLRKFILENTADLKITNTPERVFKTAEIDTAILLFKKAAPTSLTLAEMQAKKEVFTRQLGLEAIKPPAWIVPLSFLKSSAHQLLFERIEQISKPLAQFCTVSTGLKAYQTGKGQPPQTDHQKTNRVFHAYTQRDPSYQPYLKGADVGRYNLGWSGEYLSYGEWLAEPRKSVPFVGERLLVRQIPAKPPLLLHAVFTADHCYNDINSMVIFGPIEGISLKYLLGLLNSRLLSAWFQHKYDKLQRKIFPQFKVKELASFPIRPLNLNDPTDQQRHAALVALVDQMLELHCQLHQAHPPNQKDLLQQKIEATDREIDCLVYALYDLQESDIRNQILEIRNQMPNF